MPREETGAKSLFIVPLDLEPKPATRWEQYPISALAAPFSVDRDRTSSSSREWPRCISPGLADGIGNLEVYRSGCRGALYSREIRGKFCWQIFTIIPAHACPTNFRELLYLNIAHSVVPQNSDEEILCGVGRIIGLNLHCRGRGSKRDGHGVAVNPCGAAHAAAGRADRVDGWCLCVGGGGSQGQRRG